jgi:hypothetical protein
MADPAFKPGEASSIHGAAEGDVGGGAVGGVGGAGGDAVAVAIGAVAKIRSAFHELGRAVGRADGIVAGGFQVPVGVPPVVAPFPGVAGDGVDAVVVGGEGVDGAGAGVAVFGGVVFGEVALPDVAEVLAVGGEVVAPGVELLFEAAAGGEFPFGFGEEALAGPGGIGGSVIPGDVDYGVVGAGVDVCIGAFGVAPIGVIDAAPPGDAGDGLVDEAGEVFGGDVALEDEGPGEAFGFGGVAGGADEFGELGVGDGVAVDVEGVDVDLANGAFAVLGEAFVGVGAHEEGAAVEADHVFFGAGGGALALGRGQAGGFQLGSAALGGYAAGVRDPGVGEELEFRLHASFKAIVLEAIDGGFRAEAVEVVFEQGALGLFEEELFDLGADVAQGAVAGLAPLEDFGDVEAEGGAEDGAELAGGEGEDDGVEFFNHLAAGEEAEVAAAAGAIGVLVGGFFEGGALEKDLLGGFDGGAGVFFGAVVVDIFDDVGGVEGFRDEEFFAVLAVVIGGVLGFGALGVGGDAVEEALDAELLFVLLGFGEGFRVGDSGLAEEDAFDDVLAGPFADLGLKGDGVVKGDGFGHGGTEGAFFFAELGVFDGFAIYGDGHEASL